MAASDSSWAFQLCRQSGHLSGGTLGVRYGCIVTWVRCAIQREEPGGEIDEGDGTRRLVRAERVEWLAALQTLQAARAIGVESAGAT